MRTLLYRFFFSPLTVFFMLLCLIGASFPASAQDSALYTVKGVSVDVSGTSALDARNKAYVQARRAAFETIAGRLLKPEDVAGLVVPDDKILSSLVRDFEIVNEKMTTKRYAATLDFRFSPAGVKRNLKTAPAPKAEQDAQALPAQEQGESAPLPERPAAAVNGTQDAFKDPGDYVYSPVRKAAREALAEPSFVLVLPWYGAVGRQTLWGPSNPWREAWEAAGQKVKTAGVVLPVGDVDDLRDYAPAQPLSRKGNVNALMQRYGASRTLLAVAEPAASGGIDVSIYEMVDGSPLPMGRFGVDAAQGASAMPRAIDKTLAALSGLPGREGDEKSFRATPATVQEQTPAAVQTAHLTAIARYNGLSQWVAMRTAMQDVKGVNALNVRAISPTQASITFSYQGDAAGLEGALARSGLRMEALPQGAGAQILLTMGRGW